jgi:two-component system CheB/CheR fusion protein
MTSDLSPDHVEERLAAPLDQVVPARADQLLPLIGLGGSAGSIPALQTFFRTMPADSGMALSSSSTCRRRTRVRSPS